MLFHRDVVTSLCDAFSAVVTEVGPSVVAPTRMYSASDTSVTTDLAFRLGEDLQVPLGLARAKSSMPTGRS